MGSCPNSLRAHRWARYKIEALARHGFVAAFGAEMAFSTTSSFHSLVVVMPFINAALRALAFIDVVGAATTAVVRGRLPIPFVGCRVPSQHQLVYPSLPTVTA